jgi:hypothetical protein
LQRYRGRDKRAQTSSVLTFCVNVRIATAVAAATFSFASLFALTRTQVLVAASIAQVLVFRDAANYRPVAMPFRAEGANAE